MEQRLFIAINLSEQARTAVREALHADMQHAPELYEHARMRDSASWHITLLFLGEQSKEDALNILQAMRDTIKNIAAPEIVLRTLTTAPPHRPPRMVWIATTAETNHALEGIKKILEQNLVVQNIFQKGELHPDFNGHITLARLPEGRHIADHIVSFPSALTFSPTSIDLMESNLTPTGATYRLLESIDFKPSA